MQERTCAQLSLGASLEGGGCGGGGGGGSGGGARTEGGSEERLGGVEIGRVDQDRVERAFVQLRHRVARLLHVGSGILHDEAHARVLQRLGLAREEFAGELHDDLVDLAPHDLDQVRVLHKLRDRSAVAAADD
eukprot:5464235-Prymnesium_polylepis.1